MDVWKCDDCNMKFETKTLYETHKKKFCGVLGELPGPTPTRSRAFILEDLDKNRGRKSRSPKESLHALSADRFSLQSLSSSIHLNGNPEIAELEREKMEQLKAYSARQSAQRSSPHASPLLMGKTSRLSRASSREDRVPYNDQMKQLQLNHQEQLDQLKAHNERLQQEKQEINRRMDSLGLKSRQKLVSPGYVDKQADEFDGLKKFLDYKSKEISSDYKTEMKKISDLRKKTYHSTPNIVVQPSQTPLSRYNTPYGQDSKYQLNVSPGPAAVSTPQPVLVNPNLYNFVQQGDQTNLMAEINAMKLSYLQSGGKDPAILSQIIQLEQEANTLRTASPKPVADPMVQQQIMEYHLANQKLEHELQLLRMEKQQSDGLRKTPELSPEFQHLKMQHLAKMTELKQESEMLKQMTEIERMKKELQELRGEKIPTLETGPKQTHDLPFLMSTSGMEVSLKPSPYDPSAGFSVFWDFIIGLLPSCTKCRLAVGIYNGTELLSDVKVMPMVSVTQYQQTSIPSGGGVAVLGFTHPFPKCSPYYTLSLVAELQANNIESRDNPQKLHSKGWMKMELFDMTDRLISGRWKIPFRVPPIKTYITSHELNRIPQVGTAELYIRLVNARDVKHEEISTPQPVQHYTYHYPPVMESAAIQPLNRHALSSVPGTAVATDYPPPPPPSVPPPPDTAGSKSLASIRSAHSPIQSDQSILGVVVDQLYDAIDGELKLKITAYNRLSGEIVKAAGDTPVTCVTKSVTKDFLKDVYVFGLQEALFRHVQWNSQSIFIIRAYIEPANPNKNQSHTANLLDDSKLAAWTLVPIALPNNRESRQGREGTAHLNAGKHRLPLYFPPIPDITTIPADVKDYPQEWSRYGSVTLTMAIFTGFNRPFKISTPPAEFTDNNECPKNEWIKNGRSSIASKEFTPGNGFDLYIDGARFLPDSVTFTKVAGRVMDKSYTKVGPDVEVQSKLYSDIYNPDFDCRLEFREPTFPITSMLVVKIYTVDRVTKTLSCIGFSILPIFLMLGTTNSPTNDSDMAKVALNDGPHQLRIYNGSPDFTQPLGPSIVDELTPVPCASLLVRIVQAACHPNGKPKELSQYQESEWEEERLVNPRPDYQQGVYYSLSCEPSLGECQILNDMVSRLPVTVRDSIKYIAVGQDRNLKKDEVIVSWVKTQLTRSIDVAPPDFDNNYISLYHPMHGLKVSIDGALNLPWTNFTFATCCLSPPGSFYKGDQADPLTFSVQMDYSRDVTCPIWLDGLQSFPRRLHRPSLVVVVHLREVPVDFSDNVEKYTLKGQAWTVLPIFHEGYVLNGGYQLPLYQGEITQPVLNELQQGNFQDVLASFRRKKTIKYMEGSSVFVRLCDARREEDLPSPLSKVNQDYLPKEKLDRYQPVNPTQKISSLLPPGLSQAEFASTFPDKAKELTSQVFAKNVKGINK